MSRRRLVPLLAAPLLALAVLLPTGPAAAHNYSATVDADVTESEPGLVHVVLDIEYVLLAIDGGAAMEDPAFTDAAHADIQASGQDPAKLTTHVLETYSDTVLGYVQPRFQVAVELAHGEEAEPDACVSELAESMSIVLLENVPHARFVFDYDCRQSVSTSSATYRISTELFPGTASGGMTTTIVSYDTEAGSGVANLDTDTSPTMTTSQDWGSRTIQRARRSGRSRNSMRTPSGSTRKALLPEPDREATGGSMNERPRASRVAAVWSMSSTRRAKCGNGDPAIDGPTRRPSTS